MNAKTFVIRYESPSTVNGQPVGSVYVVDIDDISPGCWSYTKDPVEATVFDSYDDACKVAAEHSWPGATVVASSEATVL